MTCSRLKKPSRAEATPGTRTIAVDRDRAAAAAARALRVFNLVLLQRLAGNGAALVPRWGGRSTAGGRNRPLLTPWRIVCMLARPTVPKAVDRAICTQK